MTELDPHTLRRALRVPEDAADTVDIAAIVRRGRSLRRRRRLAAVAGGACAAAAIFGALTAITHLTRPATAPIHYPVISGRTTSAPSPRRPVPSASPHGAAATPEPSATPKATPTAMPTAVPSPSQAGRVRAFPTSSVSTPSARGVAPVSAASTDQGSPLATPTS
jgi:hypothetical protein